MGPPAPRTDLGPRSTLPPAPTPHQSEAPNVHQGDGENSGTAAGGMSDLAKNPQDDFMDVVEKAQAVIPPERYAKRVRHPPNRTGGCL